MTRFFIFDTGVRNAAANLLADERLIQAAGPALFEHRVGTELAHRAGYRGRGHALSFWRTVSGAEVDFVWEEPDEDVPIQVKWTTRPRREDGRHVERFLDVYPTRARCGLVVCRWERPRR